MGTEYADAPDVRRIARKVIDKHHPHLREVRVEYVFVTKTDKEGMPQPIESKGKEMLGRARKVSGLNAFVSREQGAGEEYFVIEVSGFAWRYLTEEQREALVDHELCHCALDPEKGTPTMRTHDVEEFGEIIQRHGLWKSDVQTFIELGAKQLKLDLQPEQKKAAKKAKTAAAESGH